mgnify:CR=1 FL=1
MTIKEIMTSNKPYISKYGKMDESLKTKAKNLLWEFNNSRPDDNKRRSEILQELLGTCSKLTFIEPVFKCDYGFNIFTHGLAVINYNCVILDTSPVNIGENVFIAPGVCIACAGHSINPVQRAGGISTSKPITIGKDVWIGANAVICGGVTIGEGSVIGAGSVVTKDIPDDSVAVGKPARVIRK